jgi:hypothetical protein
LKLGNTALTSCGDYVNKGKNANINKIINEVNGPEFILVSWKNCSVD